MIARARRVVRWVWPPPEPALRDAGRRGELAIARARLYLVAVMALVPVASLVRDPGERGSWVGLGMAALVLVTSRLVLALARRGDPVPWLGFGTSAFDVTAVSAFHLLLFLSGDAAMALQSRVTFALYLLALTATGLRYDGRICTVAGGLAVAQWLAIVGWADSTRRAEVAQQAGRFYGDTHVAGQIEEVVVLVLASALAGIIVSRARALRLSSIHDGLTRLHNRTYLEERLTEELARAKRYRRPFAVAIMDIDHFKQVNDTLGHPAGDEVLRVVAARLREGVRNTDILARYGGEEFVLVFPETDAADARIKLESLRHSVGNTPVDTGTTAPTPVTLSAGIAMYPGDAQTVLGLLEAADRRLLAAKGAGRNQLRDGDGE